MNPKVLAIAAVAILLVAGVAVYLTAQNGSGGGENASGDTITDAVGRTVEIPDSLENGIVTIGSTGPLRILSMFDVFDLITEVDEGDATDLKNGRAYSYAYDYSGKKVHPDNALESSVAERIGNDNPSLIITQKTVWDNYAENFKVLEKRCTVVVINDANMKTIVESDYTLDDDVVFNIELVGKAIGKEDRAEEIIDGINGILNDIRSMVGDSDDSVYVAGLTISGSNKLNTTFPNYAPFEIAGVKNAYTGSKDANKVELSVETIPTMDIDMVLVDPSSSDKLGGTVETNESQAILKYFYDLNNDSDQSNDVPFYVTCPIVWDSINYDCVLVAAYYTAYLQYGGITYEQLLEKVDNVFITFYGDHGENVFENMCQFFEEKSSSYGVEMPLLSEVEIVKNGNTYGFAAV